MKWFEGSIPEAISAAKSKGAVFIVHIEGEDELSGKMAEVMDDKSVVEYCEQQDCVGLKLKAGSEPCQQFSQIYPVVCIPCTFFIGSTGVPLEVIGGHVEPADFLKRISGAVQANKSSGQAVQPPSEGPSSQSATPQVRTPTGAQPSPAVGEMEDHRAVEERETRQRGEDGTSTHTGGASAEALSDRVQKANELLEQKRREKAEKQKEKEKEDEVQRRKLGQDMNKFHQMKSDMEAEEIRQARLKEKRDAKEAKDRVLQQIAQDRAERAARYQNTKGEKQVDKEAKAASAQQATEAEARRTQATNIESARLQFRLPDGSAINQQFKASDTLEAARQFLIQNVASLGRFTMRTSFPKRTFTQEDYSRTLLDLQLAPSAAIIILPDSSPVVKFRGSSGEGGILGWIMWPFTALWGLFSTFIFGSPSSQTNVPTTSQQSQEEAEPRPGPSGQGRGRPKSSYGIRRRMEGNMYRLSADDEDDDDRTTWNGNSTQQL